MLQNGVGDNHLVGRVGKELWGWGRGQGFRRRDMLGRVCEGMRGV